MESSPKLEPLSLTVVSSILWLNLADSLHQAVLKSPNTREKRATTPLYDAILGLAKGQQFPRAFGLLLNCVSLNNLAWINLELLGQQDVATDQYMHLTESLQDLQQLSMNCLNLLDVDKLFEEFLLNSFVVNSCSVAPCA